MKKFPIDLSCLTEEEISQFQEDPYTLYNGDQDVALYLRYSSTGQSDQSIEGQLRDCRAFCKANHYRIVAIYVDRATTARKDVEKRVHLMEMVADSAKQNWEYVIVWKLDRFSRDRYDSARYKVLLKKNNVRVVSATEVISSGADGILLESVLEGFAEYYSADLAEKVNRGMTENVLNKKCNGGTRPVGYVVDKEHHFQIDPLAAPFVLEAFNRYAEGATMKDLLRSLALGTNVSAALIAVATFVILYLLGIENWLGLSFSVISGLAAGVIIGQATEYYTSQSYKPTKKIAEASQTGPATVIIKGIGTGMISTMIPVVTISVAIMLSYLCANGFDMSLSAKSISTGLYGIGIAAVGMLSTLGITLATDAYGPIADNAGGNAEMSGLGEEVRERTDALDALGNTTAATGKGFAIGSAALTALALLASYIEEIKVAMVRAVENGKQYVDAAGNVFNPTDATTIDFINFFQVNLINPKVLVGAFIGAMAAFLFCGLTMGAVGRAAESMVQEVRRQFREIKGILEGKATPDYGSCVEISTRSAQREMIIPSLLAIVIPIVVGLVLGVAGVLGLLTGGLAAGFTLAVFMSNSGGAWDNAKKLIEEGNFGGKGSENHKATVVGDTVGDPFKDTSGPSLNILIKLMSMVSIVMAGLTIAFL